jgi:outer membrane murein-binding lipoprotein Lpp
MANLLIGTTLLLTESIRGCLQRAEKSEDVTEIRSILAEIESNVDQLVAAAKAAGPRIRRQ